MAKKLISDIERFRKSFIIQDDECWVWQRFLDYDGYGHFKVGSQRDGTKRNPGAHRWSYEYHVGPIGVDLTIDHLCRNRACVNPLHLEAVTTRVNTQRGWRATKLYCINEHPIFGSNLGIAKATGYRYCRICQRAAIRKHYVKTGGAAQKKYGAENREKRRLDAAKRRSEWTPEQLENARARGREYDAKRRSRQRQMQVGG